MPNTGEGGYVAPGTTTPAKKVSTALTQLGKQGSEPATATASSAHDMLIALLILSVFVYAMVLVAGESKTAGRFVVTLFALLVLLQGLGHANPFFAWVNKHPLQPVRTRS